MKEFFLLLLLCCFFLPVCLCLDAPNCTVREYDPCDGVAGTGSSVAEMLYNLDQALCGCVYVSGSIRISIVTSWPDASEPLVEGNFSFLYHVREIRGYLEFIGIPEIERLSLPNLRLIRGEELFVNNMFALTVTDSYIKNLYMPKLTEITNGNAFFSDSTNPSVCNLMEVDWTDILSSGTITNTITGCTGSINQVNCSPLGCDNCWCEDSADECCQIITKDCEGACGSGRCNRLSGNSILCCDDDCAAGCTGGTASDCNACVDTSVLNEGTCQTNCPPRYLLDSLSGTVINNPDFRFELDRLCVIPCPDGTFESTVTCVDQCPGGTMSIPSETGGMKCMACEGVCLKECQGGISSGIDTNCTIILGSLIIENPASDPDAALSKLKTIQHITGSLSIEFFSYTSFPYLSNLQTVGSDYSTILYFPCNMTTHSYSIYITGTQLVSIDLSSLREINHGGVSLSQNLDLCFVGDFEEYITNSSADVCLGTSYRRPVEECISANLSCHPQCNESFGCWGPDSTQCVVCKNFEYNERCFENCGNFSETGSYLYNDFSTRMCQTCHEFCLGPCNGEGPKQCEQCAIARYSPAEGIIHCLNNSCPVNTYNITNGTDNTIIECINCSSDCLSTAGCGGPLGILDMLRGCYECQTVILQPSVNETDCISDPQCPTGYYEDQSITITGASVVCSLCNELCSDCIGPGIADCIECKHFRLQNGTCAMNCPIGSECQGGISSGIDTNCTIILGSLMIVNPASDPDVALSKLKTIQHITGSLSIEFFSYTSFPYLSNLQTVGSDYSSSFPCGNGTTTHSYSIYITGTQLVSIDLSSLREINGGVSLSQNLDLCFVGDFEEYITNSSADVCLGTSYRRPVEECISANLSCHPQCNESFGCWGPDSTQCVVCKNFEYNERCFENCGNFSETGSYLYNDFSTRMCQTCHEFCLGPCNGEGPTQCEQCAIARYSPTEGIIHCLNNSCPVNTYNITNGTDNTIIECINCSSDCLSTAGCGGPLGILDMLRGCYECQTVILQPSVNETDCISDPQCPTGYYEDQSITITGASVVCSLCNELCSDCIGPGIADCIECKHFRLQNGTCVMNCPIGSVVDSNFPVCTLVPSSTNSLERIVIYSSVALAAVIMIFSALLVGVIFISCRRRIAQKETSHTSLRNYVQHDNDIPQYTNAAYSSLSDSLDIPADKIISFSTITMLDCIGQGEFGKVYKANIIVGKCSHTVAVKTIKGNYDYVEIEEFLKESLLMKDLCHPNVMMLIGICIDAEAPYIILPYMEGGSLLNYLRKNKESLCIPSSSSIDTNYFPLKSSDVKKPFLELCLQIAKGMEYLMQRQLVHRDLAARNCMLDKNLVVKVADFGLSKGLYDKVYFRQQQDTSTKLLLKWLAVESIEYGIFTEKTDVWAFGITCWEIFSGGLIPYFDVDSANVHKLLKSGKRLEMPDNKACSNEIYEELMMNCWLESADNRPTFTHLVQFLEKQLTEISGYLPIVSEIDEVEDPLYI